MATDKQVVLKKINDSDFSTPVPLTIEEEGGGSGGGGGVFWIKPADNFNSLTENDTELTPDVTLEEVVEAYNSGMDIKVLGIVISHPGGTIYTVLDLEAVSVTTSDEPTSFTFRSHVFVGPTNNVVDMTTYQAKFSDSDGMVGSKKVVNLTASST